MSKKKKPKIKRRRKLNTDELFNKKAKKRFLIMDFSIREAFPNSEERTNYINSLIEGLETEPIKEL